MDLSLAVRNAATFWSILGNARGDEVGSHRDFVAEHRTPSAAKGFDAKTSRRNAKASTANTDVYDNADGSVTRRVYPATVNFRDTDGTWRPLDNHLNRNKDGRLSPAAHAWGMSFAAGSVLGKGDPDAALAIDVATKLVSLTLPGGQTFSYGLCSTGCGLVEVLNTISHPVSQSYECAQIV